MKNRRRLAALASLLALSTAGSMVPITAGAAPQNVMVSPIPIEQAPLVLDGAHGDGPGRPPTSRP